MRQGKHTVLFSTVNRDLAQYSYSLKWSIGDEEKHTCGTETTLCEVEELQFKYADSTGTVLKAGVTSYSVELDVVETKTSCLGTLGVLGN